MRHYLFVDNKIKSDELLAWQQEDILFWQNFCDITPVYDIKRHDFSFYPTFVDNDGDIRPDPKWVTELTNEVHKKHHDYGVDFVMLLIHQDNWRSSGALFKQLTGRDKGIWGTNFSGVYRQYHVQYCRWHEGRLPNTFGTNYHERHHALDALILTETGVDINKVVGIRRWDAGCTHGGETPWKYIRWKENTDALVKIAPHLRNAIRERQRKHNEHIMGLQKTVIGHLQTLLRLWRKWLSKKDGVGRLVK